MAFEVGTALNAGYVVVQLIFGIFVHSLALIADAGHISAMSSAALRLGCNLPIVDTINGAPELRTRTIFPAKQQEIIGCRFR